MARGSFSRPAMSLLTAICAAGTSAAELTDEQVIAAHLNAILTTVTSEEVAKSRDECITGAQADTVAMAREVGLPGYADASDLCVTVLIRTGRDGRLLDAYAKIVADNGGDRSRAATVPDAIGGALLKQKSTDVPIGNGLAVGIKPALAFDAGFVVAYRKGEVTANLPDVATLKSLAEQCLGQSAGDMGLCFSAGYALAVHALSGVVPPLR